MYEVVSGDREMFFRGACFFQNKGIIKLTKILLSSSEHLLSFQQPDMIVVFLSILLFSTAKNARSGTGSKNSFTSLSIPPKSHGLSIIRYSYILVGQI